ncbi:MAG: hypothetical protein HYV99_01310 [Betaproteobacteria bacterium]|nr:hypothetical protein [Betaproteobacteria bacterium]
MPMSVSATKNYVLEIGGCGVIRFYSSNARLNESGGSTAVQVATPYTQGDVFAIHRVPSVDIQYLLHPKYQPRKLARYSDTCFRLECVRFDPPATLEYGARPAAHLQASALSGDGITLTTINGAAAFFDADCGRQILVLLGCNAGARAGISAFTCAGSVTANVCVPFINTNRVDCGHWKIAGSPLTSVTPGAKLPVGAEVTLTFGIPALRGHATGSFETDCGKFILANGGMIEIKQVTSCTAARGIIRGELSTVSAADSGGWGLEESLWSSANGFPAAGAFLDGRLFLASCHRFAGSKSGDYENFGLGVNDDDGLLFSLDSDQLQEIKSLVAQNGLILFTLSGEFRAIGGEDNPITPSNIHVEGHTRFGSGTLEPVAIGNAILFVTRSGRKIREFTQNPDTLEGFVAPDLLLLARHPTERSTATGADPTIVQMAYQQEPDSRLWAVRSDGVLLSCTYLRDQNVVAWSRHITEGDFESVAVIPHPDGNRDQVWLIVKRTINGVVKRYIEILDDAGVNYPNTNVDSAYTCDRTTSSCTIAGLSHLECKRVTMVGDGGVYPDQNVIGGNVTLDLAADKVEVGLPYDSVVTTVRPELRTQTGTSSIARMRWSEIVIRVKDSIALDAGTEKGIEILPFRSTCDPMNCAPSLFTGEKRFKHLGWDCGKITVKQTLPLPSTILSIAGVVDLGGS